VLVLYLIYYLTKTDNDVMINKDWDELKNMPSFWSTIFTGLILLIGIILWIYSTKMDQEKDRTLMVIYYGTTMTIFGLIAFMISGTILALKLNEK
jgi:hypothetical protein